MLPVAPPPSSLDPASFQYANFFAVFLTQLERQLKCKFFNLNLIQFHVTPPTRFNMQIFRTLSYGPTPSPWSMQIGNDGSNGALGKNAQTI